MAKDAGNTRKKARRISVGTSTTITDSLSKLDKDDFFRFAVGVRSSFDAQIPAIPRKSNYDLEIQRQNGTIVATSRRPKRQPEALNLTLESGVYFVRVNHRKGKGNYSLQLSLNADNAGETFAASRDIAVSATPTSVTDFVGVSDPSDFYRFTVGDRSILNVALNQLTAGANVTLFDANQNPLLVSGGSSAAAATLQGTFDAGTYFLRVAPDAGVRTTYNLTVEADLVPDQAGQDFASASNLIADVGFTPVQVSDYVSNNDPADFYLINATTLGSLQVDLTGIAPTADLDIILYDSNQGVLSVQGGAGAGGNEQILVDIPQTGVYYVAVVPATPGNSSTYNLSATLAPPDNVGDSTADATLITTPGTSPFPVLSDTPQVYSDFVGGVDIDVFKLVFDQPLNFLSVRLRDLSANLDVRLYQEGNVASALLSNSGGTTEEFFEGSLNSGTYYLEIIPGAPGASSPYNLELSVSATSNIPTITRDVNPTGDANARALIDVAGTLFFVGEDGAPNVPVGLWKSQGTLDTTVKVGSFTNIGELASIGSSVYFSAGSGASGTELWKWVSGGGVLGTVSQVADIAAGTLSSAPTELTAAQNSLYFIATATGDATGNVLYRLDGSGVPVALATAGDVPNSLTYVERTDTLYYKAGVSAEAGDLLWKIDNAGSATPGTPVTLSSFGATSPRFISSLQAIGSDLFFFASDLLTTNNELRRIDIAGNFSTYDVNGTTEGSIFNGSAVGVIKDAADVSYAYFQAEGGPSGEELFRVNLSNGAIDPLNEIAPGPALNPQISNFTVFNNKLYFSANNGMDGAELWVTDPNSNPLTATQIDIFPGLDGALVPNSSNPTNLVLAAGKLYFSATGIDGRELYSIDNTGTPPTPVASGPPSSSPEDLIVVGDLSGIGLAGKLYFTADSGTRGREVWTA